MPEDRTDAGRSCAPRPQYDWRKIKAEYITGSMSYRALAERYGIPYRTVEKNGLKGQWTKARQAYRQRLVRRTTEAVCKKASRREANKLAALQEVADTLIGSIGRMLEEAQAVRERAARGKLDTKAARDLAAALKDMTAVMRSLHNLPTVQEQSAMAIAVERLALNTRKAEGEEGEDGGMGVIEVAATLEGLPE